MAVILNCDHAAERVAAANKGTRVVCLADAGWFPLIPTPPAYDGITFPSAWFNGVWQQGFKGHNASISMHPDCLADKNESTAWLCTMPQIAAQYVSTPSEESHAGKGSLVGHVIDPFVGISMRQRPHD